MGVEFKRASAASNVVWAIGGDHQVYVYVYGLEVAIRVKECVYENQRWNPVNGFSDQLLPTDRPQWSTVCGLRETTRQVRLNQMILSTTYISCTGRALNFQAWPGLGMKSGILIRLAEKMASQYSSSDDRCLVAATSQWVAGLMPLTSQRSITQRKASPAVSEGEGEPVTLALWACELKLR